MQCREPKTMIQKRMRTLRIGRWRYLRTVQQIEVRETLSRCTTQSESDQILIATQRKRLKIRGEPLRTCWKSWGETIDIYHTTDKKSGGPVSESNGLAREGEKRREMWVIEVSHGRSAEVTLKLLQNSVCRSARRGWYGLSMRPGSAAGSEMRLERAGCVTWASLSHRIKVMGPATYFPARRNALGVSGRASQITGYKSGGCLREADRTRSYRVHNAPAEER